MEELRNELINMNKKKSIGFAEDCKQINFVDPSGYNSEWVSFIPVLRAFLINIPNIVNCLGVVKETYYLLK